MKNSIIKFAISLATGLIVIALSILVLANSDIETVVKPDEVMAAPLQPQNVEPPLPQQGPPYQRFPQQAPVRKQTDPSQRLFDGISSAQAHTPNLQEGFHPAH